jgi:hypothetical protein
MAQRFAQEVSRYSRDALRESMRRQKWCWGDDFVILTSFINKINHVLR